METTFFYLTMDRLVVFESLKTSEKLHLHGPLAFGQKVAVHKHNQPALYIVRGLADFLGGAVRRVLGLDAKVNAVLVPSGHKHGWGSLPGNTSIEHVSGQTAIDQVLGTI